MVVAMALAVGVAWLVTRRLRVWWQWLLAAFFAGAAVAFAAAIVQGLLGVFLPGQAVVRGIATAPINGVFCVLCAWAMRRRG